jgi:2-amino-4-hydroxy-6-hydroxymethyldihydropteridine diphosphokinase
MNLTAPPSKLFSAYLLLGSNMGNRRQLVEQACSELQSRNITIVNQSSTYESEPWGFKAEVSFLNVALQVHTLLLPHDLLCAAQQVERRLGRTRDVGGGYASRPMDIDILFYEDEALSSPLLTIPHPLLHQRRFALTPLAEIAPNFTHPVLKKTVAELLLSCGDTGGVYKVLA